jgi:crossover junction endodeoxyribonuclease RuvC
LRLIGLDPGLQRTGWGVIAIAGNRLSHVAHGTIAPPTDLPLAERLLRIRNGLAEAIGLYKPEGAAVEETFVNVNPASTLKLGLARGVALLVPAEAGLAVAEYQPAEVKKSVVGTGGADKKQVQAMVQRLLPGVRIAGADAADALAIAICHAHVLTTRRRIESGRHAGDGARP